MPMIAIGSARANPPPELRAPRLLRHERQLQARNNRTGRGWPCSTPPAQGRVPRPAVPRATRCPVNSSAVSSSPSSGAGRARTPLPATDSTAKIPIQVRRELLDGRVVPSQRGRQSPLQERSSRRLRNSSAISESKPTEPKRTAAPSSAFAGRCSTAPQRFFGPHSRATHARAMGGRGAARAPLQNCRPQRLSPVPGCHAKQRPIPAASRLTELRPIDGQHCDHGLCPCDQRRKQRCTLRGRTARPTPHALQLLARCARQSRLQTARCFVQCPH